MRQVAADYVYRLPGVLLGERAVLLAMTSHLDLKSQTSSPSYATLAAQCSMSRRSVIRIVQALERKGILTVYHSPGGARIDSTAYQFNLKFELTETGDIVAPLRYPISAEDWAERLKAAEKSDKKTYKNLLEAYRDEMIELAESAERDWHDHRQTGFFEPLICTWLDEEETQTARCVMVTKSRKYKNRRCPRPAIHGFLCGLHYRFKLLRLQAKQALDQDRDQREEAEYQERRKELLAVDI